jgi:hypothetical protein
MADQANIFTDQQAAPAAQQQAPDSSSLFADQLKGILNEQGQQKYDSLPKALEGLAHSQQYIPQLKTELLSKEAELVALRAQVAQQASIEDVVSRLSSQQKAPQELGTPPATSGLDEQAVMQLVQQQLGQAKQLDQQSANTAQVQQALSSKFGDKAAEMVQIKARDLNTTPEALGQLAKQNPSLVLALFNTSASSTTSPTIGSVNIPPYSTDRPPLEKPTKSLLSGATSKQQREFMLKVKADVYAKHGITQ